MERDTFRVARGVRTANHPPGYLVWVFKQSFLMKTLIVIPTMFVVWHVTIRLPDELACLTYLAFLTGEYVFALGALVFWRWRVHRDDHDVTWVRYLLVARAVLHISGFYPLVLPGLRSPFSLLG